MYERDLDDCAYLVCAIYKAINKGTHLVTQDPRAEVNLLQMQTKGHRNVPVALFYV